MDIFGVAVYDIKVCKHNVKHLHRMKVRPDTEVDDAFDCGEVGGDTTETAAFGQDV